MSNNIYTKKCLKKYHYVYCILEIPTNKKYIGARSTNKNPSDDLGKKYFSSSRNKEFVCNQKERPHNYKYEILLICNNREEAILEEIRLHNLYDVAKNPDFYNRAKQTAKYFDTTGKVSVIDKDGNTMQVNVDDPRYLSGELKSVISGKNNPFYGKTHSKEALEKMSKRIKASYEKLTQHEKDERSKKTKETLSNPDVKKKMSESKSGCLSCVNKNGEIRFINKELYESQVGPKEQWEWVAMISYEGKRRKGEEQIECPHCSKLSYKMIHNRYHGDKCKKKIII